MNLTILGVIGPGFLNQIRFLNYSACGRQPGIRGNEHPRALPVYANSGVRAWRKVADIGTFIVRIGQNYTTELY